MALDALAVKCLTNELRHKLIGGKIDKVYQPEKDEIILNIRTYTDTFRLLLSAGSAHPRVHLTQAKKQNPLTAPLFCMLLRKHLSGNKITDIRQEAFERIIIIDLEGYDELGDLTEKHIIAEIMGRHSNIILTDSSMKIIDCIKHVDITVSSVRQVLPGITYCPPPEQNKIPITEFEGSITSLPAGTTLSKALISMFSGISPLTAREIIYSAYNTADMHTSQITDTIPLERAVKTFKDNILCDNFSPCIIQDEKAMKIIDFSALNIRQYEGIMKVTAFDSMNELLDSFYTGRDALERMKQKSADINKLLHTILERCYKKRLILAATLKDAENKDTYKCFGDLITANAYAINEKQAFVELDNFYDPEYKKVRINLDPTMTAIENAQRYYKKYNKAKTAETEARTQIEQNEYQIEYLESTLVAIDNCTTENDINAIREELAEEGYLKRTNKGKLRKQSQTKPMHIVSVDGFDIYVGKNNTQNDILTLKTANSADFWFHTKQIHGSHVIIKLGLDKEVPESTIIQAAQLAAYYSKGRSSNQVPVDYTRVKNVRKPNGAKPGMVIYDHYNTLYVTPTNYEGDK